MNQENINIDELKTWIGNSEVVIDEVSQGLEKRFRATLDIEPGEPIKGDRASSGSKSKVALNLLSRLCETSSITTSLLPIHVFSSSIFTFS